MAEEECDYMSDGFIIDCGKDDVRPGLVHDRKRKREIDMEKKKKITDEQHRKKCLPTYLLANEQLKKGLENPIGPENKGFLMLKKMGFTPGSSIGTKENSRTEPISINLKNDRKGFGMEKALADIREKKEEFRRKAIASTANNMSILSIKDYRSAMSKKAKERSDHSDLIKSEKVCFRLDNESDIELPKETWFWPKDCLPEEDDVEEEESDFDISTKLEIITIYLRGAYNYCIWCGLRYEDSEDLTTHCPGPTRDEH